MPHLRMAAVITAPAFIALVAVAFVTSTTYLHIARPGRYGRKTMSEDTLKPCGDIMPQAIDAKPIICMRDPGHIGAHQNGFSNGECVRWPNYQAAADEQDRVKRYDALKLAIEALAPVARIFDFTGRGGGTVDYGHHVTALADRLGDYIENGKS